MRKTFIAALLAAPLLAHAGTNLLTNGSFESPAIANGSWNTFSAMTGWTVGTYGVEVRNNVVGTAEQGSNFIELDTTQNSWISQTVNTVVGQTYLVSFYYSDRTGTTVGTNGVKWSFVGGPGSKGGSGVVNWNVANNSGNNEWHLFTTEVVAKYSTMTLTLAANGKSDSLGSSVDNVSITAVPEPGSMALMLAGVGALGIAGRRRKTA